MHNLNLPLALGLLSAIGRATPVLKGSDDFLSPRQLNEAPTGGISAPVPTLVGTLVAYPIGEAPVPSADVLPRQLNEAPTGGISAPVPTLVGTLVAYPIGEAPVPSADVLPRQLNEAPTGQTSAPVPTFVAYPIAEAPATANFIPLEIRQAQTPSNFPSEPTSTGPSVSVQPSSDTTQVSQATASAASLSQPSQTSTAAPTSTG